MSTTSTVVAARAGLIEALQAHATVTAQRIQVADGWQGPDTEDEGIYLTDLRFTNELVAFKTARQPRLEVFEQTVVIQAFRAASAPQDHDDAVARVITLYGALEDIIATAEDVAGELLVQIASGELTTVPFESGWAARLTAVVVVSSDLS